MGIFCNKVYKLHHVAKAINNDSTCSKFSKYYSYNPNNNVACNTFSFSPNIPCFVAFSHHGSCVRYSQTTLLSLNCKSRSHFVAPKTSLFMRMHVVLQKPRPPTLRELSPLAGCFARFPLLFFIWLAFTPGALCPLVVVNKAGGSRDAFFPFAKC